MPYPPNPFLQLTIPRVASALARLKDSLWEDVSPVECSFGGSFPRACGFKEARKLQYKKVDLPFEWGKVFDEGWFELSVPNWPKDGYLCWRDDGEGTLHVDGVPFYGFDVAHRYCKLPAKPSRLHMHSLCLQSAIWHPEAAGLGINGSRLVKASIQRRNDPAWDLYHDVLALFELVSELMKCEGLLPNPEAGLGIGWHPPIDQASVVLRRILRGLDDIVNSLDLEGIDGAIKKAAKVLEWLRGQHVRLKAVLTGHAHIDLVWLWPERVTAYKGCHTFATVHRMMEAYPEFIFSSSQPALLEAVESVSPELMKNVRNRIQSGRWEFTGATYVESDTLLACGEALARSFLLGQEAFQTVNGKPAQTLWLPDVFGYSACLPQIMKQTGVESFFTSKLTWSNINRFPYSSFIWRSPDGYEVVCHITQETGYNQTATPSDLIKGGRAYRQSDIHDEFLAPTGYGDGGGGVTEEMCEKARRFRSMATLPAVEWGSVEGFFKRLSKHRDVLPVWQGELYLEYHRGALTSHSNLKNQFRAAERSLQTWEAVRCAMGGGPLSPEVWKRMVFAQFHDYIPGSSVWEVYEEAIPELTAIVKTAHDSAVRELSSSSSTKANSLFNPLPLPRTVLLDGGSRAVHLPPLTGGPVSSLAPVIGPAPVEAGKYFLRNSHTHVTFDKHGLISCLEFDGVAIPTHGPLARPVIHPDYPHRFEAWDIDRQSLSLEKKFAGFSGAEFSGNQTLLASVTFHGVLGTSSRARVTYSLDAFHKVLHIDYDIDWREEHALLRIEFPTAFLNRATRFGAPFGSVLRAQQPGDPRSEAMFESPGSRWISIQDDGGGLGLSLLTESKYGFSSREGVVGISLLRGVAVTGEDKSHAGLLPPQLRRGGKRCEFTDQGQHKIRLALATYNDFAPRAETPAALAETVFGSLLAYQGTPVSSGFLGIEGGESLVPCWAKPANDGRGWILRLHEVLGKRGVANLSLASGFKAHITDLTESHKGPSAKKLPFSPNQILSVRVYKK
jgi:alpha-mannosidase